MKTLILGDIHFGKGLSIGKPGIGSALNSRVIDQLHILDWVIDQADQLMAQHLILTGDIFEDTKPSPQLISLFVSWLKKCTDHNLTVHIIIGNHDILRSGQFYTSTLDIITSSGIENVFVYKQVSTIHTDGASFTFIPFRDRRSFNTDSNVVALEKLSEKLPYELSSIGYNNYRIVVGHLALEGSIPVGDDIDDMANELLCPLKMFEGYDYVWMGHVHKPQVLSHKPHIAHIGSMDLSNFAESDHNKILIVFNPSDENPVSYINIPTRPLKPISISVPPNTDDPTQYVINEIMDMYSENKLLRTIVKVGITLLGADLKSVDRTAIEKVIYERGAFYIPRFSEERKLLTVKKQMDELDNTVNEYRAIKMFADSMVDESIREKFISVANDIVNEYYSEGNGGKDS